MEINTTILDNHNKTPNSAPLSVSMSLQHHMEHHLLPVTNQTIIIVRPKKFN